MVLSDDPTSASSARHACHCGKSFARKEHLTRHQATHNQPAFVCNICQRRFSRKELLRRHSSLHDPSRTRIVVSCDACRGNKTKCSGGNPCSLCARRGISCTFRSGPRKPKRVSTARESAHGNISTGGDRTTPNNNNNDDDDNDNDMSLQPQKSGSQTSTGRKQSIAEGVPLGQEWLQNLLIVPSKPLPQSGFRPLSPGIGAIYELLLAEKSSLEACVQESDELQRWLDQCLKSYFKHFHARWPILNAPSFDATTEHLCLAAAVCVIGTWLRDDAAHSERLRALQVHDALLQRLLHDLIDPDTLPAGKRWPIEFLQAVLLTLIFSLYRTDANALSSTMLLRSVFITVLRDKGMFDSQIMNEHLRSHYSGSFAPYVLAMREKFKRLLAFTFQFDAYFSLVQEKPPILHRQEIGIDLIGSFALWNAHGLDIFAKRMLEEPTDRTGFQISAMTECPGSFTASQLFVEDISFGICGILQRIWVFMQSSPSRAKQYHSISFQKTLLIETLDTWRNELDKIKQLIDPRSIASGTTQKFLLVYRGEDESTTAILALINTLVQDATVLYYYMKMVHFVGFSSTEFTGLVKQTEDPQNENWRTSKDVREALACALQLLKMAEMHDVINKSFNPLHRHALVMGAKLIRKVLTLCERCTCETAEGQQAPEMHIHQWTEIGGSLSFDGTRLCACQFNFWSRKFDRMISSCDVMMEATETTTG